jgi:outer membrane receptor protein involved in Fe transport
VAPPPSDIEVLVIKGRQHEDLLKDTAISGASFDAKELENLRIQDISDLAEHTTNLEIKSRSAASNPTLFIRGIGLKDYNANSAGAVAIYQDGININAPAIQLFQLYDVESVEVLRGPQGSGSGRNATAGAIRITSVVPDGEWAMTANATYGNYNTIQAEGAIGLPLVRDLLSARFAFSASFADGNTDNECAGWDPESIGLPRLTEEDVMQAWVDAGSPTNPRRWFPSSRAIDAQGRPLVPDSVCIWQAPGQLLTSRVGGQPMAEWVPETEPTVRTLEDFRGLDERVNDVHNWAARGILRYQPLEDMDWVLNAHGGRNRSGSRHLQMLLSEFKVDAKAHVESVDGFSEVQAAINSGLEGVDEVPGFYKLGSDPPNLEPGGRRGGDPFSGYYDQDGVEFLDAYGVGLRGTWDLGGVVVKSVTGYEWYDRLVEDEGDASPQIIFPGDYTDSAWQVSEELRVEGEGENYRWSIGGLFLQEKLEAFNLFPATQNVRVEQFFDQEVWHVGPYAGGRFEFTEELSLEGGVRYNVEHKSFTLGSEAVGTASGIPFPEIPEDQEDDTWMAFTGDVTFAYKPYWSLLDVVQNDNLQLYVKYSRGMKSGHFNAGLSIRASAAAQRITAVRPEFIHAVETGFKSGWLDDRFALDVAGFRYWYTDLQVFDITNEAGELPLQQLFNSDARVWGAEVDLTVRPLPGLTIQAGFGWLDSRFEDFVVSKAVSLGSRGEPNEAEFDYSGNPLISAPSYNVSGIVEYEIPFFGLGSLIPGYDVSWRSKIYFDPAKLDPISQEPYWLHNARIAYRTPDGRIEVAGWVENLLDEQYKADAFDLALAYGTILEVWGDPRTYGVTVTFTW